MRYTPLDYDKKPKKYTECLYCGHEGLHYWHHVFNKADKNRSEKFGAVIYPCHMCHTGNTDSIHKQQSQEKMNDLKRHYQLAIMLENGWDLDDWHNEFERSYI